MLKALYALILRVFNKTILKNIWEEDIVGSISPNNLSTEPFFREAAHFRKGCFKACFINLYLQYL